MHRYNIFRWHRYSRFGNNIQVVTTCERVCARFTIVIIIGLYIVCIYVCKWVSKHVCEVMRQCNLIHIARVLTCFTHITLRTLRGITETSLRWPTWQINLPEKYIVILCNTRTYCIHICMYGRIKTPTSNGKHITQMLN